MQAPDLEYLQAIVPNNVHLTIVHKGYGSLYVEARYDDPFSERERGTWIAGVELQHPTQLSDRLKVGENEQIEYIPAGYHLPPEHLATLMEAVRFYQDWLMHSSVKRIAERREYDTAPTE